MLLMIDNYDSFTYNLVQYFGELKQEVVVFRNDEVSLDEIAALRPAQIVISPGPCTPNEAGISVPLIRRFAGEIPILGVCLGHQSIGQAFGGRIVHARQVMHGKVSTHPSRRSGRIPGTARAVRGHALSLVGHRARLAARSAGGHRVDRRRRDHGGPAQEPARTGRPVPPRVDPDSVRPRAAAQFRERSLMRSIEVGEDA